MNPDTETPDETVRERCFSLFEAYNCLRGEGATYIATHFQRFWLTLSLVPNQPRLRVLEVGTSAPFAFTLMMTDRFPDAEIVLNDDITPHPGRDCLTLRSSKRLHRDLSFRSLGFDAERDPWPVPSESFDVVLFMEVLEHLQLDPLFVFSEAWRVLVPVPEGRFVVSTPNIGCLESVQSILELKSPYTFGGYSHHGAVGRHNREFVPSEVEALGRAVGFETLSLTTKDCYGLRMDTAPAADLLATLEGENDLRGQTIFYVGRKSGPGARGVPEGLYEYDPLEHLCEISVEGPSELLATGDPLTFRVTVTNRGEMTWRKEAEDPTRIGVQLLDANKALVARDFQRFALPHDVASGETAEIVASVRLPTEPQRFVLRFDVVHEHVAWFEGMHGNRPVDIEVRRP